MSYRYSLIGIIFMLLPLCANGYQIDYDGFPSCNGMMLSSDYALETQVVDMEGGVMSDGNYQITSSFLLNGLAVPTDVNDFVNNVFMCELYQNYPNPFNPETTIHFSLKERGTVKISIFNHRGQMIKVLTNSAYESGHHDIKWTGIDYNGRACTSGVYIIRMEANKTTHLRMVVLLK